MKLVQTLVVVLVLLSASYLSCAPKVTDSPEPEATGSLNMQIPGQARASETVVIKIIDDAGKPVSGARIYSTTQLGDTAKDGSLVTFFKQPGDYELSGSHCLHHRDARHVAKPRKLEGVGKIRRAD